MAVRVAEETRSSMTVMMSCPILRLCGEVEYEAVERKASPGIELEVEPVASR